MRLAPLLPALKVEGLHAQADVAYPVAKRRRAAIATQPVELAPAAKTASIRETDCSERFGRGVHLGAAGRGGQRRESLGQSACGQRRTRMRSPRSSV